MVSFRNEQTNCRHCALDIWFLLSLLPAGDVLRAVMIDETQNSDERILFVAHKHWASFLHDVLYVILPALVAFALLLVISNAPQSGVNTGIHVLASILFPLSLLAVVIMATILWSNYYLDMVVVTDRRLFFVSQTSLIKREVFGWNLHEIRRVDARRDTFLETVFNFGTVQIATAESEDVIPLEGIPDPERLCSMILKQDDQYGRLQETTRKQKELLKFLSHEVKGHLTKSKAAFAAIIEGDFGPVTEPLAGMAHAALEDSQKGVETVMSILDNASVESGEMTFRMKPFDLAASVRKVAEEFRITAAADKIAFVVSIASPCMINGDQEKIERHVIRNLIDNAIRYTPVGQIDIVLEKERDVARFEVSDTGIGMTESDMQRLFTQGGHGEHSRDVNPESTGYGLFIAKKIVDMHEGKIWAKSPGPNKGSTFYAEFPVLRT